MAKKRKHTDPKPTPTTKPSRTTPRWGTIAKYFASKGYGFIQTSKHQKQTFFHITDVDPHYQSELSEGDSVYFTPAVSDDGRNRAIAVHLHRRVDQRVSHIISVDKKPKRTVRQNEPASKQRKRHPGNAPSVPPSATVGSSTPGLTRQTVRYIVLDNPHGKRTSELKKRCDRCGEKHGVTWRFEYNDDRVPVNVCSDCRQTLLEAFHNRNGKRSRRSTRFSTRSVKGKRRRRGRSSSVYAYSGGGPGLGKRS